jgi:subtilisin family serine protease
MSDRSAFLRVTLRAGEARPFIPCHLDCLVGAARPAAAIDGGGRVDRSLGGRGRFHVRSVFHARRSLGRIGQQAAHWDSDEEALALSRTYLVEVEDIDHRARALDQLRAVDIVEAASIELLGRAFLAPGGLPESAPTREEAMAPFEMVGAAAALRAEPGSHGVRVAVVDTGVAVAHPELTGRLLSGYDTVDLGLGRISSGLELLGDTSGRDDVPDDDVGHGTHVTGIIAAAGRRLPRGVGGECVAIPVRVLAGARSSPGGRPFGVGSLTDIDCGIKLAADRGAAVVNLSLGTPATDIDPDGAIPHEAVCEYAERRGVVLVAASGNDGTDVPFFPAALPTVLAVGSVGPNGQVSSFTSRGPHVVLHAPGEDIVGLGLQGYRRSSGTSHAAPFVSGAAALLTAAARRSGRELAPAEVRAALVRNARPRAPTGPPVLDAAAALAARPDDPNTAMTTYPTEHRSPR